MHKNSRKTRMVFFWDLLHFFVSKQTIEKQIQNKNLFTTTSNVFFFKWNPVLKYKLVRGIKNKTVKCLQIKVRHEQSCWDDVPCTWWGKVDFAGRTVYPEWYSVLISARGGAGGALTPPFPRPLHHCTYHLRANPDRRVLLNRGSGFS